jgi:hypothetical protein
MEIYPMSEVMVALIALQTLKVGGKYVEPDGRFELPAGEADRVCGLGAARRADGSESQPSGVLDEDPGAGGSELPLEDEIVQAIAMLDPDTEDDWTQAGKPDVRALETVIGKDITAQQRDKAWERFQAERDDD